MDSKQKFCKICHKPIDSVAFNKIDYIDSSDVSMIGVLDSSFCSELCFVIDELLDPTNCFMGDIDAIISHLRTGLSTDPRIIDKALSSDLYKELRGL